MTLRKRLLTLTGAAALTATALVTAPPQAEAWCTSSWYILYYTEYGQIIGGEQQDCGCRYSSWGSTSLFYYTEVNPC